MFPKISVTPKSSILIGFSIIKPSILGYPYFWKHPYLQSTNLSQQTLRGGHDVLIPNLGCQPTHPRSPQNYGFVRRPSLGNSMGFHTPLRPGISGGRGFVRLGGGRLTFRGLGFWISFWWTYESFLENKKRSLLQSYQPNSFYLLIPVAISSPTQKKTRKTPSAEMQATNLGSSLARWLLQFLQWYSLRVAVAKTRWPVRKVWEALVGLTGRQRNGSGIPLVVSF